MKLFIFRVIAFSGAIIIIPVFFMYLDVFKVFGSYKDFYESGFIALNREMVCFRTYENHKAKQQFNSFIFGSSRSQAFKCATWSKFLSKNDMPFHFDAGGESLYGIYNKVQYLHGSNAKIDNALLILDEELLNVTYNREGHLSISPPTLSKESEFKYYLTFIKAPLKFNFIIAYTDFKFFGVHRNYMRNIISKAKYKPITDPINCDMWYGYDQNIHQDSVGYYQDLIKRKVFYPRPRLKKRQIPSLSDQHKHQLKEIEKVFATHNTNYKIVVSPLYNQIPLDSIYLDYVNKIFGASNVYDFSGKNEYTEKIENFYETSHYRPHVANSIINKIYSN